jgi:hypothetical protein
MVATLVTMLAALLVVPLDVQKGRTLAARKERMSVNELGYWMVAYWGRDLAVHLAERLDSNWGVRTVEH